MNIIVNAQAPTIKLCQAQLGSHAQIAQINRREYNDEAEGGDWVAAVGFSTKKSS